MEIYFLFAGLFSGILISLWVWPMTLLVVHRTLHKWRKFGIISGLWIALADVIYATLSRIGLVFLDDFIIGYHRWFQLGVSILFIIIWIYIYFSRHTHEKSFHVKKDYLKNFFTAFLLNIANVFNIILFTIVFAKLIPLEAHDALSEILLIVWTSLGAWLRWIGLSYFLSHFKIKVEKIYILNRILGWLIFIAWIISIIKMFF